MPIIPSTREAEAGGWLKFRILRSAWTTGRQQQQKQGTRVVLCTVFFLPVGSHCTTKALLRSNIANFLHCEVNCKMFMKSQTLAKDAEGC
jgi:hypothetical protein